MAWVAVNNNGTECVFNSRPFRGDEYPEICERYDINYPNKDKFKGSWYNAFTEGYYQVPKFTGVKLPQGSIKKLINRPLTWDDEPVEIK